MEKEKLQQGFDKLLRFATITNMPPGLDFDCPREGYCYYSKEQLAVFNKMYQDILEFLGDDVKFNHPYGGTITAKEMNDEYRQTKEFAFQQVKKLAEQLNSPKDQA